MSRFAREKKIGQLTFQKCNFQKTKTLCKSDKAGSTLKKTLRGNECLILDRLAASAAIGV